MSKPNGIKESARRFALRHGFYSRKRFLVAMRGHYRDLRMFYRVLNAAFTKAEGRKERAEK